MGDVLTPEEVTCRWKTIVGAIRASGPVMERLAAVGALGKHEVALRAQLAEVTRERDALAKALALTTETITRAALPCGCGETEEGWVSSEPTPDAFPLPHSPTGFARLVLRIIHETDCPLKKEAPHV